MNKLPKFIFGIKLYVFRTVPLSIIRGFHFTHSNGICHRCMLKACEQLAVSKPEYYLLTLSLLFSIALFLLATR